MNKKATRNTKRKKKARPGQEDQASIHVGDISGGTGFAIGRGAKANVTQVRVSSTDQISQAFEPLRGKIKELPEGPEKNIAETAVTVLETEARKGDEAGEDTVRKWMNFLAETAPDAWEVAIDTFTNPIKGIGTVFKKVTDKVRAERNARKAQTS